MNKKDDILIKAFWMEFESLHNIFSLAENLIIYLANNKREQIKNKQSIISTEKDDKTNQNNEQAQYTTDLSQPIPYIKEFRENLYKSFHEGFFSLDEYKALEKSVLEGNQILIGMFCNYIITKNYSDFLESLNIFLNFDIGSNFFCNKFSMLIGRLSDKGLVAKELV